jgi:hypothetical protein
MLRYVLAVEPSASLDLGDLVEWLVPAIEVHFDRLPQEEKARVSLGGAAAAAQVRVGYPRVPSRGLLMSRRADSRCPVRAPGR